MSCSFGSGACSTAAAIASSSCSCAPHRWMERLKERVEGGEEGGEDGSIGGGGAEYVRRAHHTVETRIFVLFNIEYLKHPAPTHRALFFQDFI